MSRLIFPTIWTRQPPAFTPADLGAQINRGLVAWYPFNDPGGTTVRDISSKNGIGTLTNGPTWNFGRTGSAIRFDGSDSYVGVVNGSRFFNNNLHSASFWFNANSIANSPVLLSAGDTTTAKDYFIEIAGANSVLWGSRNGSITQYRTYTSTPTISGGWHCITIVKTGTTTGDLYIDGLLQSTYSGDFATAAFTNTSTLYIGAYCTAVSSLSLDGRIEDVRIFDRALLAVEARELFSNSYAGYAPQKRFLFAPPSVAGGFQSAWARNANNIIQGARV
jgi:hypothetical protein